MQVRDGEVLYSATDLVGFAACEHLTQLELAVTRGERNRPQRRDPLRDLLGRLGEKHEQRVLDDYSNGDADGSKEVVEIKTDVTTRAGLEAAAAATIAAMRAGAAVIYQATFLHDRWVGHADFLERVETPSALGDWSYEVADAKLARSVKSSVLVQLCEYSEHVTRIQGCVPEHIHVLTGDQQRHTLRLVDYAAYHRTLKARFVETVATAPPVATYPEPVNHCGICRWSLECSEQRRADDHLSLVAMIRRDQTRRLVEKGITTRSALAVAPMEIPGLGIATETYERLRGQAALQVIGEGASPPLHELLEPTVDAGDAGPRGFAALPLPSPGDIFLDLEGDPYALDGGLEYLFGLVEVVAGELKYNAFWGHTRAGEADAFRAAVDLIVARRWEYPDMHVYHYAPYEQTAFRRLMGAHGTREDEVDDMLRGEVFVDLYRVVRQAVRVSTESYGLKAIETLYSTRPPGAVLDGGSSIIAYETYLVEGNPVVLDEIAAYNCEDCVTLVGLQAWLEARRVDAEAKFGPIERPLPPETQPAEDELSDRAALGARLLDSVPDEPSGRSADAHGRFVLAHLLEWHRREAKPQWWLFFMRKNVYEADDFVDDAECIGGLELDCVLGPDKRSTVYRMRFDPQDHKFSAGNEPVDPATGKQAGIIVNIDETGTLELKRGCQRDSDPLPRALMPGGPLRTGAQQAAIADVAAWVADNGMCGPGRFQAVRDLLTRQPPRVTGAVPGVALRGSAENAVRAAERLALALDGGSLAVQGPPGAGKTFTGAHMIVALIDAGRRVGITATTHGAITNLLDKVTELAGEAGVTVRAMQKADDDQATKVPGVTIVTEPGAIERAFARGTIDLAAGTSWLWARPGLREMLDVLVIDEAGQMSLADVTAVGTAARNLVLLGDPQQLAQPSQGSHPDGAEASALQHFLDHDVTLPDHRGLFLDLTFRMHPSVAAYISEIAYEGRLESAPGRDRQLVDRHAGVWFVPVHHDANRTSSSAEADAVAALLDELVGTDWTDKNGHTRPLALDDVIIVAPYNAHVAELRRRLPAGARIGTVDKFQGREGAVSIYSTASSSADVAPRGMDFLYDLHRLNVAVSRAHARAYIVASPELLRVLCHTPKQLRLANALCRYVEYARAQADGQA